MRDRARSRFTGLEHEFDRLLDGQRSALAGKYRVERVLGRGGMGVVVAAHHIQLDHT